jgi:hypothetical protein
MDRGFRLWGVQQAVFRLDEKGGSLIASAVQVMNPANSALLVDRRRWKSRVYVGDMSGVQVFGNDGRFIGRIDVEGPAYGLFVDPGGQLWVANGTHVRQYAVTLP